MLTAYLDESSDERVYTIAGLMTTDHTWAAFNSEWDAMLAADPAIPYFKMNDVFRMRRGPFQKFTDQQRTDKLNALIAVLNTHLSDRRDFAGSVVMDVATYFSVLEPILLKGHRDPYLWCFQGITVGYSSFIARTVPGEKINFVFDDNKKQLRDALALYQTVADLPGFLESKHAVGAITARNDKNTPALQAADLIAGQTRLYGTDRPNCLRKIADNSRFHCSYLLGKEKLAQISAVVSNWSSL